MNPLMKNPLNRTAFTLAYCQKWKDRRLRYLKESRASALKRIAFIESQITRELKAIFPPSAFRLPISK